MYRLFFALQKQLDNMLMYSVVAWALSVLAVVAIGGGVFGLLGYSPLSLVGSLVTVVASVVLSGVAMSRIMKVAPHYVSAYITGVILFFIAPVAITITDYMWLVAVGVLATVTKFVFAYRKQHIFNPAAAAFVVTSFLGFGAAWWVASPYLLLPLLIVGLLVVAKVRAWSYVATFVAVGFAVFLFEEWRFGNNITETWSMYVTQWPVLFLAFFMLTEPFTLPPTKRLRLGYAALVAFLVNTAVFSPFFFLTPEMALVIGNVVVYASTLRRKLHLTLISKELVATDTYEFAFEKPAGTRFAAGQYMEWMLPHDHPDKRGIRRYFTIASAPTEAVIRLACKVPKEASSYKKALATLQPGDIVIASQRAGDFILPQQTSRKIGCIAGGIGVTPFRSQVQQMLDTGRYHDTVLLYGANTAAELAYRSLFEQAATVMPLRLVPVLAKERADGVETGYIDIESIQRNVPDYRERAWYISGPPPLVRAAYQALRTLGVPRSAITRDYFPGAV